MESVCIYILPEECLKEKINREKDGIAGRSGSNIDTSFCHPRNMNGLE